MKQPRAAGSYCSGISPGITGRRGAIQAMRVTILAAMAAILILPSSILAQRAPVNLGAAGNYVVLSKTGITNVPPSPIVGNIGASPITGAAVHVSCAEVTGTITVVDAAGPAPCSIIDPAGLNTAILNMQTAYTDAAGRTVPDFTELAGGNISGRTLVPGLYKWGTSVLSDATGFTLSGGPNAVWIFQVAGDITLANNAHVTLAGGANANNIFWQVAGPTGVTLGTGATFAGTILSAKQVILNTGAGLNGRALAETQVTLQGTSITTPGPLVGGIPITLAPTVTSTSPVNLATNVPIGNSITATFSEAMDPVSINPATFVVKNGLSTISGLITYVGLTATFTPTANLPAGTTLTGTITTGAKDPAGVALAVDYIWIFTTGAAPDNIPPTVSSTVPISGAIGVPVGNALAATFSEAMTPLTINATTFTLSRAGIPVVGTVTYAGVTGTFTPTASLLANTLFTATITTGAKDLAGNSLAANYVWTFTTGAGPDIIPPTVSSTVPATGAIGVPVGNALTATFSEAMDPTTVTTATFSLKLGLAPVAGTVIYAGLTGTFSPTTTLAANSLYTATISTGAKDLAGNAMAASYVWTFTTGNTVDVTAPTVSSTVPASGATGVPVGNALTVTFSEAMNPLTITTATFGMTQGGVPVAGAVTYAGLTATFRPTSNLAATVPFIATVTTGAQDLAGNALAASYSWGFTTGVGADITPPTVSSTSPATSATGVPTSNALTATFSEPMDPTTITTATFSLSQAGSPVSGTVLYAGLSGTFRPNVLLAQNTVYTATVNTGSKDLAGNSLAANYVWTFTTGTTPDTTAPEVTSTSPVSGALLVPLGNALSATFSEAIDPATVTPLSFTLRQGAIPVTGTVVYSGLTATFRPTVTLAGNTAFTATITTAVRDLAGNAMAGNYSWNFTTGGAPDSTLPFVTSTQPVSGALLVTVTTNIVANFSEPMDPLTVSTATYTLRQGTTPVSGTVTYAGTSASFRPALNLAPNTVYTAQISGNATDLAGNRLVAYQWSFTTGTTNGQTPICTANFAALAGSSIISSGTSVITGDLGVSPGTTITGFPPGTLKGTAHANDAAAISAMADFTAAYRDAVARTVGPVAISGNIGGQTFTAGLYRSASSLEISSGQVILDGKGDVNSVFIFQIGTTLTTTVGRQILLVGGAKPYNVYWQVGTSATLGDVTAFKGNILADQSITVNNGSVVEGRLMARTGTITLQSNIVVSPAPFLVAGGIFNAASASRTVAAGGIAAVFGYNLASSTVSAVQYPLLTLGGTTFQVGTQAAPLFMVSCNQVNIQIPWEVAGQTKVAVTGTAGGQTSLPETATVSPFAPGIFSVNQTGSGQGAVEIAPTALLAAPLGFNGRPVARGEYIAIFATGLGAVTNQPATGAPAPTDPLARTTTQPTVTVGGVDAQVTFSGLVPGFSGLYQVNALIPSSALSGDAVNLVLTIGGVQSNMVTIAIQ